MSALPAWLEPHWRGLSARLQAGTLPHALFLAGPRGLGKGLLAEALALAALCRQRAADGRACGQCTDCRRGLAHTHPDRLELGLQEKSNQLKVDQVRELSRALALTSEQGGHRIGLLNPADALNTEAANALLKTLEEPAPGVVLILIGASPWRLPATVLSRCQCIDIQIPEREQALAWLRAQGVSGEKAGAALDLAEGAPLRARVLLAEGALERRQEIERALDALRPEAELLPVHAKLAKLPPAEVLSALHQRVWRVLRRALLPGAALTGWPRLRKLWTLSEDVGRARQLLDTPIRFDWLLADLLLRWQHADREPVEASRRRG